MTLAIATTPPALLDLLGTAPADLLPGLGERHDSTPAEARERADRLCVGIVGYAQMRQDIADAFAGRDWLALGYDNWPAYVEGEFGELLAQLSRGERQQAVADLRGQGMSTRQIADATGIGQTQVRRDLAEVSPDGSPATVTGSDGKQHPATRPAPKTPAPAVDAPAVPPAPSREPDLTAGVVRALYGAIDLGLTVAEISVLEDVWPDGVVLAQVQSTLERLCEAGRVVMRRLPGGDRWILTPEPGAAPSTAPAGSGPAEVAPRGDGAASAPEPKPSLRIVPDAAEVLAAEQRDARALLSRAVDLLAPVNRKPDWADVWVKQLGPYDDELSELVARATEAIAVLDDLIERCGR